MIIFNEESDTIVSIKYKNWKGNISYRRINPKRIKFACNEYHKEPQWLMDAYDMKKEENRTFAMKDILGWEN